MLSQSSWQIPGNGILHELQGYSQEFTCERYQYRMKLVMKKEGNMRIASSLISLVITVIITNS